MGKGALGAGMNKDVLAIGGLLLTLFLLMVIVAITFIGSDELKEVTCETSDSTYVWNASLCTSDGTTEVDLDSIDNIELVEATVLVVLGLLTLVVIVGLFAIVIKAAIGFAKSF